ncbi:hypothetical protein L218DRAFT_956646 [Marasmius fiardii PR-910]|nr:hypothetical protein L218DRAFT_956646 [Marasmius fiardii PR-910]
MSNSTNSRDSTFPATSIGRSSAPRFLNSLSAQGSSHHSLSRTPSHESLNNIAHPLLSTSPTSAVSPSSSTTNLNATAWDNGFSSSSGGTTTLGYVPYTPRHRPPSSHLSHGHSASSTSTSPTPSVLLTPATPATHTQNVVNRSPGIGGSHVGDATAKLQLMNLKSAAQGLGLDTGSVGWGIVERLMDIASSSGENGEEEGWREVWDALSSGKATLVLPLDPLSSLGAHISITRNDKERDRSRGSVINAQFISPEIVKNHILFVNPSDRKDNGSTQIVTLSGLRGFVSSTDPTTQSTSILLNSTLHPSTKSFKEISNPSTRATGFASLLPLPSSASGSRYPTYTLPTRTKTFTFPSRFPFFPYDLNSKKPPLPPRRSGTTPSTVVPAAQRPSTPSGGGGRLAGLVSLFGRSGTPNANSQLSTSPAATDGLVSLPNGSRPPSIVSVSDKASIEEDAGVAPLPSSSLVVSAYSISTTIHTQEVLKGIWGGCCAELTEGLTQCSSSSSEGSATPTLMSMPDIIVKRALEFMDQGQVFPVLKLPSRLESDPGSLARSSRRRKSSEKDRFEINEYGADCWKDIEDVADRWQNFYADLEDEVRTAPWKMERTKTKSSKRKDQEERTVDESEQELLVSVSGSEKDVEEDEKRHLTTQEREKGEEKEEQRVREIMERVERVVCASFGLYGRLFPQPSPQCVSPIILSTGDDATENEATDSAHDEALASRIAALNLVDLGLSDLDIDTPTSKSQEEALLAVVKQCGDTLSMLETVFCPKDKAAVLVKAHQVLVDGLGKLPEPVQMKSQEEIVLGGGEKEDGEDAATGPAPILGGEEVMSPQAEGAPSDSLELDTQRPSSLIENSGAHDEAKSDKPKQQALSLDTLMPLLILSVVKANPPHLVSHLLFTQRFRNRSFGGEEAYCLVNLMAVAEFIGALDPMTITSNRLGPGGDVSTTPGSGPIPIPTPNSRPGSRLSMGAQVPLPTTPPGSIGSTSAFSSTSFTLRHRVEQQVDALSNSANKVLTGVTGVVDTSFELFKSFTLPAIKVGSQPSESYLPAEADGTTAPWNEGRQMLVRRDTGGFSIRGLKLPGLGGGGSGVGGKAKEEEMVSVSRAGSVKSRRSMGSRAAVSDYEGEDDDEKSQSEEDSEGDSESEGEEDGDNESDQEKEDYFSTGGDARSIKSFESMMSSRRKNVNRKGSDLGRSAKEVAGAARKSLSDRLARVSGGIGGGSRSGSRASPPSTSLLLGTQSPVSNRFDMPSSQSQSPAVNPITLSLRLAPPKKRFLECTSADDLRLKDIAELLTEYKRLVDGVRSIGGFAEEEEDG